MKLLDVLKKVNKFAGDYFAFLIIAVAGWSMYKPVTFQWVLPFIPFMLGLIMFGMGMTLKTDDFKLIFLKPKDVFLGAAAQYTIMPFVAFALCCIFKLPPELAAGVILVGTCPGGTSSNVMTYLAKGDIALSVSMTTASTLLAPFLTPLLTLLLAGKWIPVSVGAMFLSIAKIILLPLFLSMIVRKVFGKKVQVICDVLPLISVTCIVLIAGAIVSANAAKLLSCGLVVLVVIAIHNALGLCLGYFTGKLFKISPEKQRTLSIEVGMQNSGLAVSLAMAHFTPMAAIPAAIAGIWHNITGPILATYWSKKPIDKKNDSYELETKSA